PGGKGGSTPLVSSVLMSGIPASIAGVPRICMVTPPAKDGSVNPHLLVAADFVGIKEVFKTGSAWGIAALAYGTETIPKTDIIVGPGNIYVTLAKKLVSGTVGIDMIAGPSEILVIADESANPEYVAADLLSQAEHDALASSLFITTSPLLAREVNRAIDIRLNSLLRKDIASASLSSYGGIIVVKSLDEAFLLSNRIAPEHLELMVADPFQWLGKINNAGAVFMGEYSPEPVGDYIAGPNHVLPTAGTARFASALSVDNFIKKTSLIFYSKADLEKEAGHILRLAQVEGLDAHAAAITARIKRDAAES
ncbi:MAG: histidinol dehydrogenase, partial [Pseudomonadota bacterium]